MDADLFRAFRYHKRINQADLAAALDVHVNTVKGVEQGILDASSGLQQKFAQFVKLRYLGRPKRNSHEARRIA